LGKREEQCKPEGGDAAMGIVTSTYYQQWMKTRDPINSGLTPLAIKIENSARRTTNLRLVERDVETLDQ
jgi:hypothetical protein